MTIRSYEQYVKNHPERRSELDEMGFVWDDLARRWEETRDALKVYHKTHKSWTWTSARAMTACHDHEAKYFTGI